MADEASQIQALANRSMAKRDRAIRRRLIHLQLPKDKVFITDTGIRCYTYYQIANTWGEEDYEDFCSFMAGQTGIIYEGRYFVYESDIERFAQGAYVNS